MFMGVTLSLRGTILKRDTMLRQLHLLVAVQGSRAQAYLCFTLEIVCNTTSNEITALNDAVRLARDVLDG